MNVKKIKQIKQIYTTRNFQIAFQLLANNNALLTKMYSSYVDNISIHIILTFTKAVAGR